MVIAASAMIGTAVDLHYHYVIKDTRFQLEIDIFVIALT
jgi:hypothetical protein